MNAEKVKMLESIFGNVNTWLHFAEAKNAAIVAFNVAVLDVVNELNFCQDKNPIVCIMLIVVLISTISALISFIPILKSSNLSLEKSKDCNLLLYTDIASFSNSREYMKELYLVYWKEQEEKVDESSQLEKDLCAEIYENSKITIRKCGFFKVSVVFDIMACAIGLFLLVFI